MERLRESMNSSYCAFAFRGDVSSAGQRPLVVLDSQGVPVRTAFAAGNENE